ncbi:HNH endonuclease [Rhodococcus sp. NPDC059968]|uniref:HNH endonuclease n=1 Tax=Rhodococcus sp. NPDC059968 TaxID=3347017 RepID=UPI00366F8BD0
MRDAETRDKVLSLLPDFVRAELEFELAVVAESLHELRSDEFKFDGIEAEVLVKRVYEDGMVGRKAGRVYYDVLMQSSPHERCPLCGFGRVKTLDHHLPKMQFPALCVSALNLVPACNECNKSKLEVTPAVAIEQTLHPYFDRLGDDQWLFARVMREKSPSVEYDVRTPANWGALRAERLRHHVQVFDLLTRFSLEANSFIPDLRTRLQKLLDRTGAAGVSAYLSDEAESRQVARTNGYQGVAFQALASDEWFCNGGFAEFE